MARLLGTPADTVTPSNSFSLECNQWGHGTNPEYFDGEFHFDRGTGEIHDALECQIHAENLSTPAKKTIPVRVAVRSVTVGDRANALIDDLVSRMSRSQT